MKVSTFLFDKKLFNIQSYPCDSVKREIKKVVNLWKIRFFLYKSKTSMDMHSSASYKMFQFFSIASYKGKDLCLTKICIMKLRYRIKISMTQFIYFTYILVKKHVKASEISSVKSLKSIDTECITDTYSSSTLVRFQ